MVHGIFFPWLGLVTLEFERFFISFHRWLGPGKTGKSSEMEEKMWTSVWLAVVELGKERKRRWSMASMAW